MYIQGCVVEVQMQTGEVYEGVLRAISPNMEIALSVVHVKGQVCHVSVWQGRMYLVLPPLLTTSLPLSLPSSPFFSLSLLPSVLSSLVQSLSSDKVYERKVFKFANVVTISAKSGSNPQLGDQLVPFPSPPLLFLPASFFFSPSPFSIFSLSPPSLSPSSSSYSLFPPLSRDI